MANRMDTTEAAATCAGGQHMRYDIRTVFGIPVMGERIPCGFVITCRECGASGLADFRITARTIALEDVGVDGRAFVAPLPAGMKPTGRAMESTISNRTSRRVWVSVNGEQEYEMCPEDEDPDLPDARVRVD